MSQSISIDKVAARVYRAPLAVPVQTSFGTMHSRPMVLVRVTDTEGNEGWGEVWCNFPSVGAEHRARLIDHTIAPMLQGRSFESASTVFEHLDTNLQVLAIQSGEPGPFAQAIAGTDLAVWDLLARRAGQPLWQYLGGDDPRIRVYASGLNPTDPQEIAQRRWDEGYRHFKLKVGFGAARDLSNLESIRKISDQLTLMVDANQAWSIEQACEQAPAMQAFNLAWMEEPLRADQPWPVWQRLQEQAGIPLAAGENIAGTQAFEQALHSNCLQVVQPDIAKWGGLSHGLPLARRIMQSGLRFCPHYLGGGIGLLASAHLLAAAGGDGMMEIDANDNPLRSQLQGPLLSVEAGWATLTDKPGLGLESELDQLDAYRVSH